MPVKVPDALPALAPLERERVPVIKESRAFRQDIRPLRILILNLMPLKLAAEHQLLRLIGNSPLQTSVTFLRTESYTPAHTPPEHLERFYRTFPEIRDEYFDGCIVTGAPVEHLPFEDVAYWGELCRVMEWSRAHVCASLYICWGAQAALYYHYGVQKHALPEKLSGVFTHRIVEQSELTRGFDDAFLAPHSRHTSVDAQEVGRAGLRIIATSPEAGLYLASSEDERRVFITGHPEYDREALRSEYVRDTEAGLAPRLPANYFPENNPAKSPEVSWSGHAHLLFSNWLHSLYQRTPYDLRTLAPL